ncbi:PKD domain-containing protein [Fulvivirga sediminis]|uniref:PKD domain-containing protein n=1 Tax=Fulvivirga sediminis TaxID=2803949 RepID=A0A937F5F3_9BACT|nr:PKD domain-containing protein [Fulvivirga sediminis]MBL3654989.1 PKD domain-containing protein [Fulvivirga sediminis]
MVVEIIHWWYKCKRISWFKELVAFTYILFLSTIGHAQIASFSLPANSCLNQNILINNQSSDYDSLRWNFCSPHLLTYDYSNISIGNSNVYRSNAFAILPDTSVAVFFSNGSLRKVSFENDFLESISSVQSIANSGGSFSSPNDVKVVKEDGRWVGFVSNESGTSGVSRLFFGYEIGSSLESFDFIEGASPLTGTSALEVINEDDQKTLITIKNSNGEVNVVNFSNGFLNQATSQYTFSLNGLSKIQSISKRKRNGVWEFFVVSNDQNLLLKLVFNQGLDQPPLVENIILENHNLNSPYRVSFIRDEGRNVLLVLNLGDRIDVLVEEDEGWVFVRELSVASDNIITLSAVERDEPVVLMTSIANSALYRFNFSGQCYSSLRTSNALFNPYIQFSQSGVHPITLTVFDENGNSDQITKTITITDSQAPDINFNNETICSNTPVEFTNINNSGGITSYNWSFGDSNTSTEANPSNQYATSGDYTVNLSVESANGCSNFVEKDITIYDEPVPSFDSPTGLVCTNDVYTFKNTTDGSFGGNLSWKWKVNGDSVANTQDLNYEFPTGGYKEIKLIASIPGCAAEAIDVLTNINDGPVPAFQVNDDCVGTPMQFSNQSEGNITNYHWDFGNGYTSSLENPFFEYGDPGTFDVTLNVINDVGCESDLTRSVSVYQLPNVQFNNELACEGSLTQFIDASEVGDANLQAWRWEFDDGEFSTERNPTHNFAADGRYDVKLAVTTTNGCKDSIQQPVSVNPAPEVDFSYDKLCLKEVVEFTDQSEPVLGFDNISWAWDLGGVYSGEQNPSITFQYPINYNIGLTVTSENLCSATKYKTITVNPVPDLSFASEFNCDNAETHIYDITDYGTDVAAMRKWSYSNGIIGADSSIYYAFDNAGTYKLSLLVDTQNGCTYEKASNISIYEAPIAQFSSSITFGAPPLDVDFTNESIGAENYRWYLGDVAESTDENVSYNFVEEADYWIDLVAFSAEQCTDTTSQMISVLDPNLELELANVFYQDGVIILNLKNNGTISLDSISLNLDMGNEVIIERIFPLELLPGQQKNITLDFAINRLNAAYLCVSAYGMVKGIVDADFNNNTQCIQNADGEDVVVLPPRPNPSPDAVFVRVVTSKQTPGSFFLYDVRGQLVKQFDFSSLKGYKLIEFNVSDLSNGFYLLKSEVGNSRKAFRLTVKH